MIYSVQGQEVTEDYFAWHGPDGTALIITKETIAGWIREGDTDEAVSRIYSVLNSAFSEFVSEGTTTITIAPDGTPLDCTMERA